MKIGAVVAVACALSAMGCGDDAAGTQSVRARDGAPFLFDVVHAAQRNTLYRRVVFTGSHTQLALMSIPQGGDIGAEAHPYVEQLIFVVSGHGKAVMDDNKQAALDPGDFVVAPPGVEHNVINTGDEPLQLYTVYSPPNHIDGRVQRTKADAEKDTEDEQFSSAVR